MKQNFWIRLTRPNRDLSNKLLRLALFNIEERSDHCYFSYNFVSSLTSNPVLGVENRLYIGSKAGIIYILNQDEITIQEIDLGEEISFVAISADNTLIATTEKGNLFTIK